MCGHGAPRSRMEPGEEDPTDPAYAKVLLEHLVQGTRLSNSMPVDSQHDYAASFPGYNTTMSGIGSRLTGMIQGFVHQQDATIGPSGHGAEGGMEDVSARFDSVVELSDHLLERVDADLERFASEHEAGLLTKGQAGPGLGMQSFTQQSGSHVGGAHPQPRAVASKPQHRWRDEVTAHYTTPEKNACMMRWCEPAMI